MTPEKVDSIDFSKAYGMLVREQLEATATAAQLLAAFKEKFPNLAPVVNAESFAGVSPAKRTRAQGFQGLPRRTRRERWRAGRAVMRFGDSHRERTAFWRQAWGASTAQPQESPYPFNRETRRQLQFRPRTFKKHELAAMREALKP